MSFSFTDIASICSLPESVDVPYDLNACGRFIAYEIPFESTALSCTTSASAPASVLDVDVDEVDTCCDLNDPVTLCTQRTRRYCAYGFPQR